MTEPLGSAEAPGADRGRGAGARKSAPSRFRRALALSFPGQHGAWSALGVSFLLGAGAPARPSLASLALVVAVAGAFLSRYAAGRGLKLSRTDPRRAPLLALAAAYATVACTVGIGLAILLDRPLLLPLGFLGALLFAASLELERRRQDHTTWGEILGMTGLTLAVPAALYTTTSVLDTAAAGLWLLAALFFAASVLRVRFQVRGARARAGALLARFSAGGPSLLGHLLALALAFLLEVLGWVPPLAPLALLPTAADAAWQVAAPRRRPPRVRQVGHKELAHAVIFLATALLVCHLAA